jgi:hypothetical protein
MPVSVAYAQQVPASYATLSKRDVPVNEFPFIILPPDRTVTNENEEHTQFGSSTSLGKVECHVIALHLRLVVVAL